MSDFWLQKLVLVLAIFSIWMIVYAIINRK